MVVNLSKKKEKELIKISRDLRIDVIKMLGRAKSGHTAGSLGMADIFSALYFHILSYDAKRPRSQKRDFLYLSNGHICPILYASLSRAGFFPRKELSSLRKINSLLQGHPHNTTIPGVENSSGPLAQGVSMAVGTALALKRDGKKNNVYALCGDGEMNEGQIWEAFMIASHYALDNLTLIVDYNAIQLDGPTKEILDMGDMRQKLRAFGFEVKSCDGNDVRAFIECLDNLQKIETEKPKAILAKTIPGKGVPFMEHDYRWHGKAPTTEEMVEALQILEKKDG